MLWRDPKYAWGWKFRLVERKRFMPKKLIFTVFIYFLMCTRKMFIFNFVMCSGSYRVHELLASNNWKRCCCCRNAGETETQYRHKTIRRTLSAIYRHREIFADVCDLISSLSKLEITNTRIDSFYGSIKLPPSCRGICCSCWRTRERVRLFGFYFKICMKRHHKKWDEKRKGLKENGKISTVLLSNNVFLRILNAVFSSSSSSSKTVTRIEPTDSKMEWIYFLLLPKKLFASIQISWFEVVQAFMLCFWSKIKLCHHQYWSHCLCTLWRWNWSE